MRYPRWLAMAATVAVVAVPTAPVQAHHGQRVTLVIGDSITYRSSPQLRELRPNFVIQGVPGSNANSLTSRLKAYLDHHRAPDRLVVALGSNGFHTTEATYQRAVDLLPRSTVVGLVTAWRNPAIWGRARSMIVWHNTQYMFDVARTRPHTCTIGWRRTVVANPRLLVDGLHPTVPRGERVWAHTVVRGIRGCH
jgi:hypothetical protein